MYTCKGVFHTKNGEIVEKKIVSALFGTLPKNSRFRLTIEEFKERGQPLNDYYWVICKDYLLPALVDAGYNEILSKEHVHEFFKKRFQIISTEHLSDADMQKYIEKIYQYAAEYLHVALPSPNSQENWV
jgi:hypothetical protein